MSPLAPGRIVFIARLITAGAAVVAALGACGHSSYSPSPTPVRLEITGPINHMVPGATGQMHAQVTLSDNTTSDVTTTTAWFSSAPTVVTISATGELHALAVGIADIRATYDRVNATKTIEVSNGP